MWHFIFGPMFTDSTAKVADREVARLWKQLKKLESGEGSNGSHAKPVQKNKDIYSLRVSRGFRLIYTKHKEKRLIQLLFLGNHDEAYDFAETLKPSSYQLPVMLSGVGVIGDYKPGLYPWVENIVKGCSVREDWSIEADAFIDFIRPGLEIPAED